MNLFNVGTFLLNSGRTSGYKVDCDELSDEDIQALARIIHDNIPFFAWVEGVPTGGLRLAEALQQYARPSETTVGLIVDDVLTTGGSMERLRADRTNVMGVVIFNRMPQSQTTPGWIKSVWRFGLYDVCQNVKVDNGKPV